MTLSENRWVLGLLAIILIFASSIWFFAGGSNIKTDDPWAGVPQRPAHVDHKDLLPGPYDTGQEVTAACVDCHEDAAGQILHTAHWRWESDPVAVPGREGLIATGKKSAINNFCIGIQGNWESCTACHAGYGWEDEQFDFTASENIDCLVCHDRSGAYRKGKKGLPLEGIDLVEVAQSVGVPGRENCGGCHFRGGGGNAVKHGDLDESLFYPSESLDVHMGRFDFACVDCHRTQEHEIAGRSITVSVDNKNQIACTDCHDSRLHADDRINLHTASVACQTCHIPAIARKQATKTHWDWSQAGDPERPEDTHHYMKIKGSFIYEKGLRPQYLWFNGLADRYLVGDQLAVDAVTPLNLPHGDIGDANARIWPFKIHWAKQPYDARFNYLLPPKKSGKGGYSEDFDWDRALEQGAEFVGLEYSGEHDFAETEMYWPTTHMVAPKTAALQCKDCHSPDGRMDWQALGYPGDPIKWGRTERGQALNQTATTETVGFNNEN